MKPSHQALATLLLFVTCAWGQQPASQSEGRPHFRAAKRMVMTWVPPYAVAKSRARLEESFGGVGMKDSLTHLALQFYEPTREGGLRRVRGMDDVGDATVAALRDWGHANGIRVLLCVDNGSKSWDWPLARAAFAGHPKEFAASLAAEVERMGLDGVDVDLEGNGELDADKAAFVAFIRELSALLHAKQRQLTVDTFSYIWNAPNQRWWKELLPLVDGLNTMGYQEIGASGKDWRAFAAQEAAAGADVGKLLLGMPAEVARWQGGEALEQLCWARDHGKAGVAIWDAQLPSPAWRTREVWMTLREIQGAK
jgi:hypothetical protein